MTDLHITPDRLRPAIQDVLALLACPDRQTYSTEIDRILRHTIDGGAEAIAIELHAFAVAAYVFFAGWREHGAIDGIPLNELDDLTLIRCAEQYIEAQLEPPAT